MERPVNEILSSGKPDFPFMLCWANENWTRAWDGGIQNILIKQNYTEEDDRNHIKYLLDNVFKDSRYIRIDNKPVFAVYRSSLFPNINRTLEIWREEAKKRNVELYLCRFESFNESGEELLNVGFDAAIEFPPHNIGIYKKKYKPISHFFNAISYRIFGFNLLKNTFDYKWYVKESIKSAIPPYKRYNCITPMWDNTARKRKNYFILKGSTPELYKELLTTLLKKFKPYSKEENLFFINAWNEWAEGNHLEPDLKWGRQYLEATKEAIAACQTNETSTD